MNTWHDLMLEHGAVVALHVRGSGSVGTMGNPGALIGDWGRFNLAQMLVAGCPSGNV